MIKFDTPLKGVIIRKVDEYQPLKGYLTHGIFTQSQVELVAPSEYDSQGNLRPDCYEAIDVAYIVLAQGEDYCEIEALEKQIKALKERLSAAQRAEREAGHEKENLKESLAYYETEAQSYSSRLNSAVENLNAERKKSRKLEETLGKARREIGERAWKEMGLE